LIINKEESDMDEILEFIEEIPDSNPKILLEREVNVEFFYSTLFNG